MTNIATDKHFKTLARLGYSARGVVYLIIGGLALLAAFGEGGKTTDSKGAIMEIMNKPFGNIMLVILIIGLFGYATWRFIQAVKDADSHGKSAKGLAIRSGLFISAITHSLLAIWAIRLLLGSDNNSGSGNQTVENGKAFLETDFGQIGLGAVGLIIIGVGFAHIYKGWQSRFERYMNIPAEQHTWAQPVCRFGLIARGVVWCIVGWFLIKSAMMAGGGEIKGMGEALASLRSADYGGWVFGTVAAGLFAFGIYSLLEAIYRRIDMGSRT